MSKRKLSNKLYDKAYKDKDKGGVGRQGFIDWKECSEENVSFFKAREGVNKLNIIPYEITSKLHPLVKSGEMEIGDLDFMLDVWVHQRLGPNDTNALCPKKNYGKPCPACEESKKYYDDGRKEEAKALKPTRRTIMNVQAMIKGEWEEMAVFDVAHFLFMKELIEEAHACKEGENIIPFADIENGKIIKFRMAMEPWGQKTTPKYKSFDFIDREEELKESLIDKTISFDKGLILLSYKEIEKIMYGQDEEEEDEPEDRKSDKSEKEEGPPEEDKTSRDEKEDKPANKKSKCPEGHKWGDAALDRPPKDCRKCDLWDDCVDA